MVESLDESRRNAKKHVPSIAPIKEIIFPAEWKERFGYPTEQTSMADYLVIYDIKQTKEVVYLIEAADSNLRRKIKQLECCADEFHRLDVPIHNFLIVIKKLSSMDAKKYRLVNAFPKPYKNIKEKGMVSHYKCMRSDSLFGIS